MVEVHYDSQRIAFHKRNFTPGRYSTIEDHLSSTHKFYKNWSPDFFQCLASPYGKEVEEYTKGLIAQAAYPETAYKQCLGVIALAKQYGKDRIGKACERGMLFHQYSYHIIKNILENKMDRHQMETTEEHSSIPSHENIRGAKHYQ